MEANVYVVVFIFASGNQNIRLVYGTMSTINNIYTRKIIHYFNKKIVKKWYNVYIRLNCYTVRISPKAVILSRISINFMLLFYRYYFHWKCAIGDPFTKEIKYISTIHGCFANICRYDLFLLDLFHKILYMKFNLSETCINHAGFYIWLNFCDGFQFNGVQYRLMASVRL